jgi:hypothetical protein
MNAPLKPIRSACFQPDNYTDLKLFADREAVVEDLAATLESFLAPGAPGEGRVLVRGHRGVGKSILTRVAMQRVTDTLGPLAVTVDAARTAHGSDAFLRRLAADLAREAIINVTDKTLVASGELLKRLSESTKISARETQQWTRALNLGLSTKYRFLDKVQFEFGLTRTQGRSRTMEESYERHVDDDFLRELIQEFLSDCRNAGQYVVLFFDNLDQVGYGEIEEDVKRVTNLARHLFSLRDAVVIANLRSEFVSADLRKLYSHEITVEGMRPEELLLVAEARIQRTTEEVRKAMEEVRFMDLARQLTSWSDNAWGFLNWLTFFDYEPIDFAPNDAGTLRKRLMRFAERRYTGLRGSELERLGGVFRNEPSRFLTAIELDTHGVTGELLERAVRYGALVPDWLLSPDRYMLAPGLHFLAPRS